MAAIDDITTAVQNYQAAVTAALAAATQALADIQAELTANGVDPAKVQALEQSLADATTAASGAQATFVADDPGPQAPPADPAPSDPAV